MFTPCPTERSQDIADRVERFVRDVVAPYEHDARCTAHGPSAELVGELRAKAREAGVISAIGSDRPAERRSVAMLRPG